MLRVRKFAALAMIVALGLSLTPVERAYAAVGCTASISPSSVGPGSQGTVDISIQNTGNEAAAWIQVQRPTLSYSINGITQSGWLDATNDDGSTLTGGSLSPGATYGFQLAIYTGPQEELASDWSVQISPNADGSGAVSCSGSLGTSISTPAQPPSPNGESNIHLTSITSTTATIAWDSNVPSSSYVYYGDDSTYGQVASANGSTVNHVVTLRNLSPSSIYHYQVAGSDDQGNSLFSSDNTFVTPAAPPPPLQPIIINNNTSTAANAAANVPGVIIQATPSERTPPTVTLATDFSKPFDKAPLITGSAQDNVAVARMEYSIDGGSNWLPVGKIVQAKAGNVTSVTFSFTPVISDDGNYRIAARAIDSSANIGVSTIATLVLDRLAPQLGPLQLSSGPQLLAPSSDGLLNLVAGVDYRVTGSAIGGATMIVLEATPKNAAGDMSSASTMTQQFALTPSPETGLWNGAISLKGGGDYDLAARSLDGAGNATTRSILTLSVAEAGSLNAAGGTKPLSGGQVSLHYFEPSSGTWQLWDGRPYDQSNPASATTAGTYGFLVPSGKYYLKASAPGYHSWTSRIFTLDHTAALTPKLALEPAATIKLGSFKFMLPRFSIAAFSLPNSSASGVAAKDPLVGQLLPAFNLPLVGGKQLRSLDLEGKPTVLTIVSSWAPTTPAQLGSIAKVQANSDVNALPIFVGEHTALASSFVSSFGEPLKALADPDGSLIATLHVSSLPQHIFVDRTGHVKKLMLGVLSDTELLNQLGGL